MECSYSSIDLDINLLLWYTTSCKFNIQDFDVSVMTFIGYDKIQESRFLFFGAKKAKESTMQ